MATLGSEFKSSGITENTPKNIMLGAGTIHSGLTFTATYAQTGDATAQSGKTYYTKDSSSDAYVVADVEDSASLSSGGPYYERTGGAWNFDESLICATSGGSKVSIVPELTDIEVDGALVKVKGLVQKTGETATMEINPVEISPEVLKLALFGEERVRDDAEGYSEIVSRANVDENAYIKNLGYVGKTLEGKPIIIMFDYALCTSGLELEGKNKEAAVPTVTFECYANLSAAADTLPWHVIYPTVGGDE